MFHYAYVTPANTDKDDPEHTTFSLGALDEQLEIIKKIEAFNDREKYRGKEPITGNYSAATFLMVLLEEEGKESFSETNWSEIRDMIVNYSGSSSSAGSTSPTRPSPRASCAVMRSEPPSSAMRSTASNGMRRASPTGSSPATSPTLTWVSKKVAT